MGCMSRKEQSGPCPNCGFDESQPHDKSFLPLRAVLGGRYVVGRCLTVNGEAITYLGYDCKTDQTVQIREYMPDVLCSRRLDGSLSIKEGCEANYKTLMLEYSGILKTLRQEAQLSNVIPVIDILHENSTVYGIFQRIQAAPLGRFLNRCGGELNWSRAKKLFIPLLNTLSTLHEAGIIHRGISPETILIDKSGELWLSNFSTVALRTSQSEIVPHLFPGYTAPEQYDPSGSQGPWTDVYGVGAVMYKTLTGTMPPQSTTRRINDNLCPCNQLNPSVPQNVSDVIAAATEYDYSRRTQSVDDMLSGLLQTAEGKTSVYKPQELPEKRQPGGFRPGAQGLPPKPQRPVCRSLHACHLWCFGLHYAPVYRYLRPGAGGDLFFLCLRLKSPHCGGPPDGGGKQCPRLYRNVGGKYPGDSLLYGQLLFQHP